MLNFRILTVLAASIALTASPLWAVDTINVKSTGKPVQGEITTVNKTEVTIKPHWRPTENSGQRHRQHQVGRRTGQALDRQRGRGTRQL